MAVDGSRCSTSRWHRPKSCIVPWCTNTSENTPEKLFFYVPKNKKRRKSWWAAIRRHDEISPLTSFYCCEDHFDLPQDMENYYRVKLMPTETTKMKLKPHVVPHRLIPRPVILTPECNPLSDVEEGAYASEMVVATTTEEEEEQQLHQNQHQQQMTDPLLLHDTDRHEDTAKRKRIVHIDAGSLWDGGVQNDEQVQHALFGQHVAMQLKRLSHSSAVAAQERVQTVLDSLRILELSGHHAPAM